jgi:alpha-ribazole phosphatase/probable phosphoglycerate mutase
MQPTLIDLMRHGEPVGGRRYRGQSDDPLSEKGWQQMWLAAGEYRAWQAVATSPLQRCAAFADALAAKLGIPVTRDPRLMEMGFGEWEGLQPAEICRGDPHRLLRFKLDPVAEAPAGAEPLLQFHQRVGEAWRNLLEKQCGRHVLVVAHAGVIRMILAHALGLEPQNVYHIEIGNAALSRIRVEQEDTLLLSSLLFHAGSL